MILRIALLLATVLISSCGTPPIKTDSQSSVQQAELERLDQFKVTGGLGVWTDKESISTRLDWRQKMDDFDVLVTFPIGLNTARVKKRGGEFSLQIGDDAPSYSDSAALLLQDAMGLGVAVPIEQMALWIRGLPGEDAESVRFDEQNRLVSMNYRDSSGTLWRAEVLKYDQFQSLPVPGLIVANGGKYNVRLLLKKWSVLPESELTPSELSGENVKQATKQPTARLKVPNR